MRRLTPELWAHSAFSGDTTLVETRILDFNLARRSGIVINRIVGQMFQNPDTLTGNEINAAVAQEVDVDPDNTTTEFLGVVLSPDAVVLDSSRVFRQVQHFSRDTATGGAMTGHTKLVKDWSHLPMNERPISITPLRHHVNAATVSLSYVMHAEVNIDYYIVELDLDELGLLNASRR